MDKDTFRKLLKHYFIPHVEEQKKKLDDSICKRAVLVVDGHVPRYDWRTLFMLRKADIDLLILTAHSSHLTQPLDLRLNAEIKRKFNAC